jgi:AraC family transcriptional regulator
MSGVAADHHAITIERPAGAPRTRVIARGEGWSVSDMTCRLGPQDRRFEERHEHVTIAAVIEGTFFYRAASHDVLLYPGSFLLGNAGACFECGHEHSAGDRCVSFQFAPSSFEEIAAAVTGSHRFRFPMAMLPAIRKLTAASVDAETHARMEDTVAQAQAVLRLAQSVLTVVCGRTASPVRPAAREPRRINDVLRYIEAQAGQPLSLGELAGMASMSKYHFLRVFQRITGLTPYQYLLGVRLRRAALSLRTTDLPITSIAFDAGFGDLSTFHGRFRDVFGQSPGGFRRMRSQA